MQYDFINPRKSLTVCRSWPSVVMNEAATTARLAGLAGLAGLEATQEATQEAIQEAMPTLHFVEGEKLLSPMEFRVCQGYP